MASSRRRTRQTLSSPRMGHRLDIKWATRALRRIDEIKRRISKHDPAAAERMVRLIREGGEKLRYFPDMCEEVLPGIRELVIKRNYLISYRVKQGRN